MTALTKTALKRALVEERKSMRAKAKNSAFLRKTANIYRGMQKRANGSPMDFTLADLRVLCGEALEEGYCRYCAGSLRLSNLAVDHKQPIARGGAAGSFLNLMPCCKSCNWQKGVLTETEFSELLEKINTFDSQAATDIKRRLTIGGKWSPR